MRTYSIDEISRVLGEEFYLINYLYRQFRDYFREQEEFGGESFSESDLKLFKKMCKLYHEGKLDRQNLALSCSSRGEKDNEENSQKGKVISVFSGKGGVGKTLCSSYLAYEISKKKKVLIIDGDLGLSNVFIHYKVSPRYSLLDYLEDRVSIDEMLCEIKEESLYLLSSGTGIRELCIFNKKFHDKLTCLIKELREKFDYIVIDIGAGVNESVIGFSKLSDILCLVTVPDISAMTDAYGVIKVLSQDHELAPLVLLVNRCRGVEDSESIFDKISQCCKRFLKVLLVGYSWLPHVNKVGYYCSDVTSEILESHTGFRRGINQFIKIIEKSLEQENGKSRSESVVDV